MKNSPQIPLDVQSLLKQIKPTVNFVQVERSVKRTLDWLRAGPIRFMSGDEAGCLMAIGIFTDDAGRAELTDDQVAQTLPYAKALLRQNGLLPKTRRKRF